MKRLVVIYDVSEFSDEEIDHLKWGAVFQGEEDVGDYPHPDASAEAYVVVDHKVPTREES